MFNAGRKEKAGGNSAVKCSVCGVTFKELREYEKKWAKSNQNLGSAFLADTLPHFMMKCPKCGEYTCTKCAHDDGMNIRCKCGAVLSDDNIIE